ncbi:AraC family transcriptional regulator [uncultured Pseudokineococcus sp.]|uniref:AraC family transcriptional regulator n=1 Tax=uncultured Pseudokineococcus sp. TaxID=1642928 RepID=UPI00260B2E50|nr:AraC family transcriptional regulator [uncultured Pseudokineococcus sp.]
MALQSASVVRLLVSAYAGPLEQDQLLASVGLPVEPRADDPVVIPADDAWGLVERMATHGGADLPVRFAAVVTPDRYGVLGLVLETATCVREALERSARWYRAATGSATYELRETTGGGELVLRRDHHRPGLRMANECGLAAFVAMLGQVAASPVRPRAVCFRHQRPASTADYRRLFGCPVGFGAPENVVVLDETALRTPTRLADEGLCDHLPLRPGEAWRRTHEATTLEGRVREAVVDDLGGGVPRMTLTASRLGMSERTLQRRLAERGMAYSGLVDQARREVAEVLLVHTDSPFAEIAQLAGFSEQSAFCRAFRRWTGSTPSAVRAAVTAPVGPTPS